MRKPIVVKWLRLPAGKGVTLWPFIFVSSKAAFPKRVFKHELMHWYHIYDMGVLKFYYRILKEYWNYGTNDGPLEQECEEYELEPLLTCEQEWWYE